MPTPVIDDLVAEFAQAPPKRRAELRRALNARLRDVPPPARPPRNTSFTRLRAERRRVGLTQAQVGGMCGASNAAVARWEAGNRRPREHAAARLEGVFGIPLDELLARDESAS